MRRLPAPLAAVALVFVGCAACSSSTKTTSPARPASASNVPTTTAPATTTTTTVKTAPARRSTYAVANREETFVDTTRPTAKNGTYPGAPTRTLRVRFYYPAQGGAPAHDGAPFPLILFSHGWTGTPEVYQWLLNDFARAGFVVAAPAYPLSNGQAPGGPVVTDLPNQPKDASFVLDRVLAEANGTGWLHGFVDPTRIGAAGHSLGAFTTYGLAYNDSCRDARIKAAVILSGNAGGCPGEYFRTSDVPLLAIHGDHDGTVPYAWGRSSFAKARRPKFFVTMLGGTHTSDELGGTMPGQQALTQATIAFFNCYLRGEGGTLATLTRVASQPGLTKLDAQR